MLLTPASSANSPSKLKLPRYAWWNFFTKEAFLRDLLWGWREILELVPPPLYYPSTKFCIRWLNVNHPWQLAYHSRNFSAGAPSHPALVSWTQTNHLSCFIRRNWFCGSELASVFFFCILLDVGSSSLEEIWFPFCCPTLAINMIYFNSSVSHRGVFFFLFVFYLIGGVS